MNILIIGSTGMLGSSVGKYFEQQTGDNIYTTHRNKNVAYGKNQIQFDCLEEDCLKNLSFKLFQSSGSSNDFYVLNCLGTIKPFMASNPRDARYINSVFPWELAEWCNKHGSKLIHITTDCIYNGYKGSSYNEDDLFSANDDYGASKFLGEPKNDCMVIRTSIIGEEIHKNASLIEWAKSQKGKEVKGFTNHFWSGITTKQYAKVCQQIIEQDLWQKGLFHVHSKDTVNKLQMLEYFNERFNLDLKIQAHETPQPCDRSLSSKFDLCAKLNVPTVREMVMDI